MRGCKIIFSSCIAIFILNCNYTFVLSRPEPKPFLDIFPVFSQLKSLVQVIAGDEDGARETQRKFLRLSPGFSQATSLVQFINGDSEGALETQKGFVKNYETIIELTPGVGHIKGIIHMLTDEEERGLLIIKDATKSSIVTVGGVVGGLVGGPAGGAAAALATSAALDGVDTFAQNKPQGIIDKIDKSVQINNQDPGQVFDIVSDIVGTGLSGAGKK